MMSDADFNPVQVDVGVSPDTWARIYADAVANYRDGQDPQDASWNAVQEHITVHPNPMVDGEVKSLEDIDELATADERAAPAADADNSLSAPFDTLLDDLQDGESDA